MGGEAIIPLEDGTPYGWIPSSEGKTIDKCKTNCVESPSCTAFVWRDLDGGCLWKRGTSKKTLSYLAGEDCYSYDVPSVPVPGPEASDGITWTVDIDYHCGGEGIIPLEDGTPYGWIPSSEGKTIDKCKTNCVESSSCTAFVWRDLDGGCLWKRGTSKKTLSYLAGEDCYSY